MESDQKADEKEINGSKAQKAKKWKMETKKTWQMQKETWIGKNKWERGAS